MACEKCAELESALRSHRRERDRYEKASEVAMVALRGELEEAIAKRTKLEAAIAAICQKVAARLNADGAGPSDAREVAKDVVRGILEELSPGTTLDEILKAAEE